MRFQNPFGKEGECSVCHAKKRNVVNEVCLDCAQAKGKFVPTNIRRGGSPKAQKRENTTVSAPKQAIHDKLAAMSPLHREKVEKFLEACQTASFHREIGE